MQTVAARLPDPLHDRIEAYCQEHDLSKSQAIRRLTENALDHDPHAVSLPIYCFWLGSVFLGAYLDPNGIGAAAIGGVFLLIGLALLHDRLRAAAESVQNRTRQQFDATENQP